MSVAIDMTGMKCGMWNVLSPVNKPSQSGKKYWLCRCDCGTVRHVEGKSLRNGSSKNCGCVRREKSKIASSIVNRKHGMRNSRLYVIWRSMKGRIHYKSTNSYERYGGRGISICDEWENSFEAFAKWAQSHGYDDSLTLDRIDPDGNYEPSNCRWATWSEQAKNKSYKGRR